MLISINDMECIRTFLRELPSGGVVINMYTVNLLLLYLKTIIVYQMMAEMKMDESINNLPFL